MGYVFHKTFRSDLTVTYRGQYKYSDPLKYPVVAAIGALNMQGKQSVDNISVMVNGYLEMLPLFDVKLADFGWNIMAGAGIAFNKTTNFSGVSVYMLGTTIRDFAWNVGTGVTYEVLKGINLNICI